MAIDYSKIINKKKNQYYIQTWHGAIALKAIEKGAIETLSPSYISAVQKDGKMTDLIITNKYEIIFHLDGLYSYFCLDTDEENVNLDGIMTKFYNKWQKESVKKTNQYFLNIYYDNMSYTELEKESITNEDFGANQPNLSLTT